MKRSDNVTALMTADGLLELAGDDTHRYELDAGRLIVREPAGSRHGRIAAGLYAALLEHARREGGEVVSFETGFLLRRSPDSVRAPDVAYLTGSSTSAGDGYILGAPDLAVEVLSPNDHRSEVAAKVRDYLAAGTQLVWVLDPKHRTLTIHEANGVVQTLGSGDRVDGQPVLKGFSHEVGAFFGIE